ncbi:fimbrial assembly protein [Thiohalocapsa marina]|uniref:Fimbrial assembly protein n=1 Tax=Thiohalocapsa marina TaxID=424902 RepID=A0A5M8FU59_9GAMM|nr:PilN domain-containing protein [Thiohalocapsa marina]KAA6187289.1 fimbrial assembly protein [Thiohalocapsa marina]
MSRTVSISRIPLPRIPSLAVPAQLSRWKAALVQCLPARLRRLLAFRHPQLVVIPRGDAAELLRRIDHETAHVATLDLAEPEGLGDVVAITRRNARYNLCVELPVDRVLERRVALPVQVKDNLQRVVSYEIDRLTPFSAADVYYDARIAGVLARGAKLDVRLAVCRRAEVDGWLRRLNDEGAPADRLTWTGAWPGANLLPPADRPRRGRAATVVSITLLALVVVLAVAALVTPYWQKSRQHDFLQAELRQTRARALEVERLRDALDKARLGRVEILRLRREQPRMTDLLRELTERLPDGTWVQVLDFRDGGVDLRGESDQATALIQLLEQGSGLSQVSFRSPVTQVADTDRERFHVAFLYRRPTSP